MAGGMMALPSPNNRVSIDLIREVQEQGSSEVAILTGRVWRWCGEVAVRELAAAIVAGLQSRLR